MTKLTQKETYLLQDQKEHEEICIKKYTNYANQTQCPELKQIFTSIAQQEQNHLNTINQILSGQVPNMNQQQNQQQNMQQNMQGTQNQNSQGQSAASGSMTNQKDKDLCTDMLMTEKYVSSAYNTAIFEFQDANIRQTLNRIQKEEQQHGEKIFNYMKSKGLYNVQ